MNRKEYMKTYNTARREKDRGSIRIYQREYDKNNKKKKEEYNKQYHENNKEKSKEYCKVYTKNNKTKISLYGKQYYKKNKDKVNKKTRLYYSNNKYILKDNFLKKHYNISLKESEQRLIDQNHTCAVCPTPLTGNKGVKDTYVDHDHKTGKTRGLLCHHCNAMIGYFKDDVNIIQKAVDYLNSNYDNGIYLGSNKKATKLKKKELIQEQNNKCIICPNEFKNSKDTHLDHNHKTNRIRQVLCLGCNFGLGHAKEDVNILQNALDYLNKHNTRKEAQVA